MPFSTPEKLSAVSWYCRAGRFRLPEPDYFLWLAITPPFSHCRHFVASFSISWAPYGFLRQPPHFAFRRLYGEAAAAAGCRRRSCLRRYGRQQSFRLIEFSLDMNSHYWAAFWAALNSHFGFTFHSFMLIVFHWADRWNSQLSDIAIFFIDIDIWWPLRQNSWRRVSLFILLSWLPLATFTFQLFGHYHCWI